MVSVLQVAQLVSLALTTWSIRKQEARLLRSIRLEVWVEQSSSRQHFRDNQTQISKHPVVSPTIHRYRPNSIPRLHYPTAGYQAIITSGSQASANNHCISASPAPPT
ncbi:hypothetical protein PF005_g4243 [Phytophthora fragariae]|uniref:Uncharacterized protein n=1 Tax=Phytophthora fragariae TaxID=53985 RepID=A0A6A3T7J9_9STRA|nr:hypothetical protein PF003_g14740 [Phytophthora fragariae]KAE8945549.1 hypothetical protein PF009_g4801 [Phytophthora fragariae]KAE9025532.1 hypothetical protein PF011_g2997 [Phytophthora fragariae]KAE9130736.1 hypothetical protein PF010_g3758 [Phytophthora fragariae]KAE9131111.1 hypothetical protein PF007_g4252 [Phytophthora fragariae]